MGERAGGIHTWDKSIENRTPLFLLLVAELRSLGERVNSDILVLPQVNPSLISHCFLHWLSGSGFSHVDTLEPQLALPLLLQEPPRFLCSCFLSLKSHCHQKLREALLQGLWFLPGTVLYPPAASDPPESSHHLLQHLWGPPRACNPIMAIDRENQHLLFASKQTGMHHEHSSDSSCKMFVTCLYA